MMKAKCTSLDMIKAAYLYHFHDMDQSLIAIAIDVNNLGRVNEAIKKVEKAVGLSQGGYKEKDE